MTRPPSSFVNIFRTTYRIVNVSKLSSFEAGTVVTPEMLLAAGLLRKGRDDIKVLGNGEITVSLTVQAHRFTKSAQQKIEAAGGKVEQLGG